MPCRRLRVCCPSRGLPAPALARSQSGPRECTRCQHRELVDPLATGSPSCMETCGTRSAEGQRRARQRRVDAAGGHIGTDCLSSGTTSSRNWSLPKTCRTARPSDWRGMSGSVPMQSETQCTLVMATGGGVGRHPPPTATETRQSSLSRSRLQKPYNRDSDTVDRAGKAPRSLEGDIGVQLLALPQARSRFIWSVALGRPGPSVAWPRANVFSRRISMGGRAQWQGEGMPGRNMPWLLHGSFEHVTAKRFNDNPKAFHRRNSRNLL